MTLALALCAAAGAADEQVVVLQSGGVLRGTVSVSGERYVVTGAHSVVDVASSQVLLVAASLEDAYRQQRQSFTRDSADAHLALAEWCLRYHLLDAAAQELADAARLDPRDPRIALVKQRLAVAQETKSPPTGPVTRMTQAEPSGHEDLRELDSLAKDLPPGALERFTRKVQPLLVNSCTTSGCHQRGGQQQFQLDRAVLYGLSNRRTTLRNLEATLKLVNDAAPQESELLKIPRRTHGGLDHAIFGPRQSAQVTQLMDWVALVTETSVPVEPSAAPAGTEVAAAAPVKPVGLHGKPTRIVDHNVAPAKFDAPVDSLLPQEPVKFGAQLKRWQPKDEFDPEIFNRSQRAAAPQEATTAAGPPMIHPGAARP